MKRFMVSVPVVEYRLLEVEAEDVAGAREAVGCLSLDELLAGDYDGWDIDNNGIGISEFHPSQHEQAVAELLAAIEA